MKLSLQWRDTIKKQVQYMVYQTMKTILEKETDKWEGGSGVWEVALQWKQYLCLQKNN